MKARSDCERCRKGFSPREPAFTCERGCAWCGACARGYGLKCPNCGGELAVRRNAVHAPGTHNPPPMGAPERILVAATPGVPEGDDGAA